MKVLRAHNHKTTPLSTWDIRKHRDNFDSVVLERRRLAIERIIQRTLQHSEKTKGNRRAVDK